MSFQEVMDRVPAVAGMIDEMNEIIPGVPATEKNLKSLLEEIIEQCESDDFDKGYEVKGAKADPACEFSLYTHFDDDQEGDRELVVYIQDAVTRTERGQEMRYNIEHKMFPLTPDGLLKGIVYAKKSLKRYREEGPCPDCMEPHNKKLKLEGFHKCLGCTMKRAIGIE